MKDDFGYEGRRRRRFPVLERLRAVPLIGAAVFTVALMLLIYQMLQTPVRWTDAQPSDTPPAVDAVASPQNPDVPAAASPPPVPQHPGKATPTPSGAPSPAALASAGPPPAPSPSPSPSPAAPSTTRYEAESAAIGNGHAVNDHTGYSGTGFVDYDNTWGGWVQWTVNTPKAGQTAVLLRFANGSGLDRIMSITVNGVAVLHDVVFESTNGWSSWQNRTVTLPLNAGTNTIRATAVTPSGGPNVDFLEVTS